MAPPPEASVGIELVSRDPNDGENTAWVAAELYRSQTPARWDNVPIRYFRASGGNKLVVADDLYSSSLLKELGSENVHSADSQTTIHPLEIHIRTDGLHLWSSTTSKGIRIPIDSIATYGSSRIPPSSTEALRLDMIPPGDDGDHFPADAADEDDEQSFSTSVLYHIIPAPPSPTDPDAATSTPTSASTSTSAAIESMLTAITACQDHLPPPDDEPHPAFLGTVSALSLGQEDDGGAPDDEVRIEGLENFSGWITSENVDEVMRTHGLANGDAETNGDGGVDSLGPGAGSRRMRDEDGNGDGDAERMVIWQRTEE